jgi:hypothetical protein
MVGAATLLRMDGWRRRKCWHRWWRRASAHIAEHDTCAQAAPGAGASAKAI